MGGAIEEYRQRYVSFSPSFGHLFMYNLEVLISVKVQRLSSLRVIERWANTVRLWHVNAVYIEWPLEIVAEIFFHFCAKTLVHTT